MVTRLSRAVGAKSFAVLLYGFAIAAPAEGAVGAKCAPRTIVSSSNRWMPPLDRTIKLTGGEVSLKQAFDLVSSVAKLRVSYSGSYVPLERKVCASYRDAAVGDILADLLRGVDVTPAVASFDHIVLTPGLAQMPAVNGAAPIEVFPIAPVFVTAEAVSRARDRQPGYATTVIDGSRLGIDASVEDALKTVPGLWMWQSPIGFTAHYGMRGATSFGVSSPKIYIDGIEVANPLLATHLLPENIERIEVIRGPQGGALYGADAIDGVTNIITKHATVADGAPRLRVRSGFALSESDFIQQPGLGQDHLVSLQLGSRSNSGSVNIGMARVGEYMPGSYARNVNADGNLRLVEDRTVITGTARLYSKSSGNPGGFMRTASVNGTELSMQQYTIGAKIEFRRTDRVTYSALLGVDGYALNGFYNDSAAAVTLADSVLRAAGTRGARTTLRFSSATRVGEESGLSALVTIAAEHSNLQQYTERRSSNGVSAHVDASFLKGGQIAGGLRVQRDDVDGTAAITSLPMLSASYLVGGDNMSLRLRTAYGRAIRWPSASPPSEFGFGRVHVAQPILSPEQQSGLEAGVDLTLSGWLGVQLTRYDQIATGLLQTVAQSDAWHAWQSLQGVGVIGNEGWEMQMFVRRGPLSVSGSLGLVNSRVQRVATGYTGDLQAGDRTLAVPARTASMQAVWQDPEWSASLGATRAADWINYDRQGLNELGTPLRGPRLRPYWRRYDGATHLRATYSRELSEFLTLMLAGDNLLNHQTGEPDNVTVVPGRTISIGLRAAF